MYENMGVIRCMVQIKLYPIKPKNVRYPTGKI